MIEHKQIERRFIFIVAVIAFCVAGCGFTLLYITTLDRQRHLLTELAEYQGTLIEAVANYDRDANQGTLSDQARAATLAQVSNSQRGDQGFDRTGEIVLAERVGNSIRFLLPSRLLGGRVPADVPWDSDLARPARLALSRENGVTEALDYTGTRVLAAYRYLPQLHVALVVKINKAEVQRPFINTAFITAFIAGVGILVGAWLNRKTITPLIDAANRSTAELNRLFQAIEQMPYQVILTDHRGIIVYVNRKFVEEVGFTAEEAVGQDPRDLLSYPLEQPALDAIRQRILSGESWSGEILSKRKSGVDYWVAMSISPLLDAEGRLTHIVSVRQDVTQRKHLEHQLQQAKETLEERVKHRTHALQKSEAKFRNFIEKAPVGIVITSQPDGKIQEANEVALRILGFASVEEIRGRTTDQFHTNPGNQAHLQDALASGKVVTWVGQFRRHGGDLFWARCSTVRQFDLQGNAQTANVIEDITGRRAAEEQLQRMSNVFMSAADPIVIENLSGSITEVNDEAVELYGWTREELIGQPITRLVPPEDHAASIELRHRCVAGEEVRSVEGRRLRKDGTLLPVLRTLSLLRDSDGNAIGIATFAVDISELKQMQHTLQQHQEHLEDLVAERTAELLQTEALFRNTFELAAVGIAHVDTDGSWLKVNERLCQIVGYTREELLECTFQDITYAEDLESDLTHFNALMAGTIPHYSMEKRYLHKQGHLVWINLTVALVRDDRGEPDYFISVIEDIAPRKRMEQALLESKDVAEEATRAKSDFLARMSHEIRTPMNAVIGMNHLALQTDLTAKQRDYVSKSLSAAKSLLAIINDILDYSKIEAGKMQLEATDFQIEQVLENLTTVNLIKAEEKGLELIFDISPTLPGILIGDPHRLGQILINLVSNALKFTHRGEVVVSVREVERTTSHTLLQFDVRDSGIGLSPVQISRLFRSFEQADGSTTRRYGGTGLGLAICKNLVEMLGGRIWVESQPEVGSTFSFTGKFGYHANTTAAPFETDETLYGLKALVVDDSAVSRSILESILQSFTFRVHSAPSGAAAITELQAASSAGEPYKLVLMDWKMPGMNGIETALRIRTDDTIHHVPQILMISAHGSEEIIQQARRARLQYFLTKPVSSSVLFDTIMECFGEDGEINRQRTRHPFAAVEPYQALRGRRILLVEDNEINRQVASELLTQVGVMVTAAGNGQQAIEAVLAKPFDLVLMDIQMPGMNGLDATRHLRGIEGASAAELPIVAMTAHAMDGDREQSLAAGMNDHITKPIDPAELYETLLRWITGRASVTVPPFAIAETPPTAVALDTTAGLRRVGGNVAAYAQILRKFDGEFSDSARVLREAYRTGDIEQAERLAHTLKGVSGNIGAVRLHHLSTELNQHLRQPDPAARATAIEALIARLETELNTVITALGDWVHPDHVPAAEDLVPGDLAQLHSVLRDMQPHVERRQPIPCKQLLEPLLEQSWPDSVSPSIRELGVHISHYRFKEADSVIEQLLSLS